MQICQLTTAAAQGERVDCRLHPHLPNSDARQLVAEGRARFVTERAIVPVGTASLAGYFYDIAVRKNDRYLGTARSGPLRIRTQQLVNFMPRPMKHRAGKIKACGSHPRLMTARAVNTVQG